MGGFESNTTTNCCDVTSAVVAVNNSRQCLLGWLVVGIGEALLSALILYAVV